MQKAEKLPFITVRLTPMWALAFTTVDQIVAYIKENSVVRADDTEIGKR